MNIRTKGLVLAMEEEELLPIAEVPEAADAEIVPAEVEQEVAETSDEGDEVADLNTAIEDAVEDVTDLEAVGDTLERSVEGEEGEPGEGISPEAAEVAEIAVESLARRLGISKSKVMPAMESFGSSNSRVAATRIAVEGIVEMAKRAWEAIKAAFKSLWVKIKTFLDRVFNVNSRLKAAAEAAMKQIDGLKDKTAGASYEAASVAATFNLDGKCNATVVESLMANHILASSALGEIGNKLEESLKSVGEVITAAKDAKASTNTEVNEAIAGNIRKELTAMSGKLKGMIKAEGSSENGGLALAGNVSLALVVLPAGENTTGFVAVAESKTTNKEAAKSVPVLTADEMKKVLGQVIELAAENDKLKAKKDFTSKFEATANKVIGQAIAAAGKLEGNEEFAASMKFRLQFARRATSDIGNTFGKISTRIPGLSVQAAKAALNYVEGSMKQYKAAAAAAEVPAAAAE